MKRLFVLLFAVLTVSVCQTTYAQRIQEEAGELLVQYGGYADEVFLVKVFVDMVPNNYETATYILAFRAGGELLPTAISFNGKRELQSFVSELKLMRNKYKEWLGVAAANGVTGMVKTLPTMISARTVTFYDGYMNELKTVKIALKGVFMSDFTSFSLLPYKGVAFGYNVVEPDAIPIFHVSSVEDLDQIIKMLDVAEMKKNIDAKTQINNLFF